MELLTPCLRPFACLGQGRDVGGRILQGPARPRPPCAHGGTLEYEIEWAGNKKNGDAWDLDWVAADALTPDLIHEYMLKRMHGVPTVHVSVNASLAYEEVRRKLADVM